MSDSGGEAWGCLTQLCLWTGLLFGAAALWWSSASSGILAVVLLAIAALLPFVEQSEQEHKDRQEAKESSKIQRDQERDLNARAREALRDKEIAPGVYGPGPNAGEEQHKSRGAPPEPGLIQTHHDAEVVAAEWMRWLGFSDAQAMPIGPDEGIDVVAQEAVAQVKAQMKTTGRPELQQLYGAAMADSKQPLFFSLSDYTPGALDWGQRVGIALFKFDLQGKPVAVSDAARKLLEKGP